MAFVKTVSLDEESYIAHNKLKIKLSKFLQNCLKDKATFKKHNK